MVPVIPKQRQFKSRAVTRFNDLIRYLIVGQQKERGAKLEMSNQFEDVLEYATNSLDAETKGEKCIGIRTHGVNGIETASIEMNAVAMKNTRCIDPVYHVILSWPEHEKPEPAAIFDAAEHAVRSLGLHEHQYVIAIHGNTDNMHAHISVNRVHPVTFKTRNIEWAKKTLHMAARESEIKHGWSHDNGIYVVQVDGHGKKQIVLNMAHAEGLDGAGKRAHREMEGIDHLPSWHDPESLDSWLKSKVAKALKRSLPDLGNWHSLHVWLSKYGITLTDTGGGGLRLHAVSPDTGEVIDMAASKGLRLLKRSDLETRWGAFFAPVEVPVVTLDFSHLTLQDIQQGAENVINDPLAGGRPPDHILRDSERARRIEAQGGRRMHELPDGDLDGHGQDPDMPLQDSLQDGLGDRHAGEDPGMRRTGAGAAAGGGQSGRRIGRDYAKRAERKEQRAAARVDLRQRFAQYNRFVRSGDTEHFLNLKVLKSERSDALKTLKQEGRAAKFAIAKGTSPDVRLLSVVEIDAELARRKLEIETLFQERSEALRATRVPPLSWRTWLYEQSNLGDQAAISALRGIVYQAGRDAKLQGEGVADEEDLDGEAYQQQQYQRLMTRLLEEEKKERAIRAANLHAMRPYEVDALLMRYAGIQWKVTGNGNIEYSDLGGGHLFTDRGSRLTFDRVRVTDEEIQLALVHSQHKFGKKLTFTGDDALFTARMAKLADDMGMVVLNPDMKEVIASHRATRKLQVTEAVTIAPVLSTLGATAPAAPTVTLQERLQAMVLAIDPYATFVTPDPVESTKAYIGAIAAVLDEPGHGFAQHTGQGVYAIHATEPPADHQEAIVEVRYRDGLPVASVQTRGRDKGRT